MLELSLSDDGKLLFRLEIGKLDPSAVLALTEQAIKAAQQESSKPTFIQPRITTTENEIPLTTEPLSNTLNITPNLKAVLTAMHKTGFSTVNELTEPAKKEGLMSSAKNTEPTMRYLIRQLLKLGLIKENANRKKTLTTRGLAEVTSATSTVDDRLSV